MRDYTRGITKYIEITILSLIILLYNQAHIFPEKLNTAAYENLEGPNFPKSKITNQKFSKSRKKNHSKIYKWYRFSQKMAGKHNVLRFLKECLRFICTGLSSLSSANKMKIYSSSKTCPKSERHVKFSD